MFPDPSAKPFARLAELRRSLAEDPTSPKAWYWKLQVRVLAALTAIYGDYATQLPSSPTRPLFVVMPRHGPAGTKSRGEIGALLRRISQTHQMGN